MKEEIKNAIVSILSRKPELNLTGLKRYKSFTSIASGDIDWIINDKDGVYSNILFMSKLNSDCINSFYELAHEGVIEINQTDLGSYLFDSDEIYTFPIATKRINYKTLHWMPTVIKRGKNFQLADE